MKKIVILIMLISIIGLSSSAIYARAIGGMVLYNKMMDDYSDAQFENNLSGRLFFDVGTFVFQSLRFRPGLDLVDLETDAAKWATVYGIHIDWYWFFLKSRKIAPYLGFGPSLNYYEFEDDQTDNNDSDAGIEGFGGVEINLSGPISLIVEARLVIHDIADTGTRIFKPGLGILYYF